MTPNRITIKFFIEDEQSLEITRIGPIFHRWIQTEAVPGLLIDVADYKHVADGPGIILVGHDVDYALDLGHGRAGLLIRRKRLTEGTLAENLQQTLAWAVAAAQQFQQDTDLSLDSSEMEISFPDRLHIPNDSETRMVVSTAVMAVLQDLFALEIELENGSPDARRPLMFQVTIRNGPAWAELTRTAVAV